MPKHTPGPWEVRNRWYIRSTLADPLDGSHAEVKCCSFVPATKDEEHEANARLIAAGPELLAACRRMVEALSIHHMSGTEPFPGDQRYADAHQGLYAAIAKAVGEVEV